MELVLEVKLGRKKRKEKKLLDGGVDVCVMSCSD